MRSPIDDYLHEVLRDCRDDDAGGDVMSGNRELERADPSSFGIALATVDGTVYTAGDADHEFSMQSIAKLPAYALALRDRGGLDGVLDRVDTEPSGDASTRSRSKPRPDDPPATPSSTPVPSPFTGCSTATAPPNGSIASST